MELQFGKAKTVESENRAEYTRNGDPDDDPFAGLDFSDT
jgi:hypothetical protein